MIFSLIRIFIQLTIILGWLLLHLVAHRYLLSSTAITHAVAYKWQPKRKDLRYFLYFASVIPVVLLVITINSHIFDPPLVQLNQVLVLSARVCGYVYITIATNLLLSREFYKPQDYVMHISQRSKGLHKLLSKRFKRGKLEIDQIVDAIQMELLARWLLKHEDKCFWVLYQMAHEDGLQPTIKSVLKRLLARLEIAMLDDPTLHPIYNQLYLLKVAIPNTGVVYNSYITEKI